MCSWWYESKLTSEVSTSQLSFTSFRIGLIFVKKTIESRETRQWNYHWGEEIESSNKTKTRARNLHRLTSFVQSVYMLKNSREYTPGIFLTKRSTEMKVVSRKSSIDLSNCEDTPLSRHLVGPITRNLMENAPSRGDSGKTKVEFWCIVSTMWSNMSAITLYVDSMCNPCIPPSLSIYFPFGLKRHFD